MPFFVCFRHLPKLANEFCIRFRICVLHTQTGDILAICSDFFVSGKVFCALEYHALKDYGYIFKQDGEYKLAEVISSLCSVAYVRIAGLLVAFLCDLKVSLS